MCADRSRSPARTRPPRPRPRGGRGSRGRRRRRRPRPPSSRVAPSAREVAHDVAGAAEHRRLPLDPQHRHRCLRRDALDGAADVAVEHHVADNTDAGPAYTVEQRQQAGRAGSCQPQLPLERRAQHLAESDVHLLDAGRHPRRHDKSRIGDRRNSAAVAAGQRRRRRSPAGVQPPARAPRCRSRRRWRCRCTRRPAGRALPPGGRTATRSRDRCRWR